MSAEDIVELTSERDLRESYPVVEQLRPVGEEQFLDTVRQMRDAAGYRLFGLYDDDDPVAVAGHVVQTNHYHGKHAWVHDLVVDEPVRGEGHGARLLEWVFEWAAERDCTCVELASGTWRDDAHRFYESVGMEEYCLTFKRDLDAEALY